VCRFRISPQHDTQCDCATTHKVIYVGYDAGKEDYLRPSEHIGLDWIGFETLYAELPMEQRKWCTWANYSHPMQYSRPL